MAEQTDIHLHSNMFLLILVRNKKTQYQTRMNLHSNMFLLIQKAAEAIEEERKNLHSNMFLLILFSASAAAFACSSFTFQYVSINTLYGLSVHENLCEFTFQYVSINTMCGLQIQKNCDRIYIPICFY